MTKRWLPRPFDLLLLWHGLFAGAYTIAWLTAESAQGLHQFAGYAAIGLLAVRLLAAALAPDRSVWALPWPRPAMWRSFAKRLGSGDLSVFRGRTPLAPLSGLVLLATLLLVTLSGLAAEWWDWEDLHEGPAEASLSIVFIHIGLVTLGPLLRRLSSAKRPATAPTVQES